MSNDELLYNCACHLEKSKVRLDELLKSLKRTGSLKPKECEADLDELWRNLSQAAGAALELRNISRGMTPPNRAP